MNDYCRYKNGPTVKCRVPQRTMQQNVCDISSSCEYAVEQFSSIDGLHLSMAYVPFQKFENIYEIDCALVQAPFLRTWINLLRGGAANNEYRKTGAFK